MSRTRGVVRLSRAVPTVCFSALMMLPACGHVCENFPDSYTLVPGSYSVFDSTDPPIERGASVVVTDDTLRIEYTGDDGQPHFALYSYSPADTGTP